MSAAVRFEDRIAVGWPWPVRPAAQSLHYAACRFDRCGIRADVFTRHQMPTLPDHQEVCSSVRGTAKMQRRDRTDVALNLCLSGLEQYLELCLQYLELCLRDRPKNPVVLCALAAAVAKLLGQPANQAQARRQVNRIRRILHPDKVRHLYHPGAQPMCEAWFCESLRVLAALRAVIDDPELGPALFVDGRLLYGNLGATWGCAAYNAAMRGCAVLCCWAEWVVNVFGRRREELASVEFSPAYGPAPYPRACR